MKSLLTKGLFVSSLIGFGVVTPLSSSLAQDIAMLKQDSTKIDNINQAKVALKNIPHNMSQTSPVNLVGIGYQGFLVDQGIPSGAKFISDVENGDLSAEMLVQSAIEKGRLSPDKLNDQNYLNAVKSAFKAFIAD
jgi:hypothetical protein